MSIEQRIRAEGGIVRRDAHPEWTNARIRESGVRRIGYRWLAAVDADPALLRAAELHARLACVSAAGHRGLQVLTAPRLLHVVMPSTARAGRTPAVRIHRSHPLLPVGRAELVESVPDMLAHVAHCLPRLDALVVWESALHRRLISSAALSRITWHGPVERDLARWASAHSESVLETVMLHRLREAGLRVEQQVRLLGHRVDFVVEGRLVVQVDGGDHVGEQRAADLRHDARLAVEGVDVMRFGYRQTIAEWPETLAAVHAGIVRARPSGWE